MTKVFSLCEIGGSSCGVNVDLVYLKEGSSNVTMVGGLGEYAIAAAKTQGRKVNIANMIALRSAPKVEILKGECIAQIGTDTDTDAPILIRILKKDIKENNILTIFKYQNAILEFFDAQYSSTESIEWQDIKITSINKLNNIIGYLFY